MPKGVYERKPKIRLSDTQAALLIEACVEALTNGEKFILVVMPPHMKLPKDMTKCWIVGHDGENQLRQYRARKLLTWLNKSGYTPISVSGLREQRRYFTRYLGKFGEFDDLGLDEDQTEDDNSFHQLDEDQHDEEED